MADMMVSLTPLLFPLLRTPVNPIHLMELLDLSNPANLHIVGLIINSATGEVMNANESSFQLVGLPENKLVKLFNIYPNPAKDIAVINFNLNEVCDVEIEITDLSGKVVYTNSLNNATGFQNINLNVENMNSGLYFVNLKTNGESISKKLTITK